MTAAIIIAFRDRGVDPLRQQNLDYVAEYWRESGLPVHVVDDGRDGDAQFNRSAAYNRGAAATDADVLCYIESDTVLPWSQLSEAIELASDPGLVVPFSHQLKMDEPDSEAIRGGASPDDFVPVQVNETWTTSINHGSAVVVSREALAAVGRWDEEFRGHGHDDTAMMIAFHVACQPARFVKGIALHLYHLEMDPGLATGNHITAEDCAAQDANRARLMMYRKARDAREIRQLTQGLSLSLDWRTRNWVHS